MASPVNFVDNFQVQTYPTMSKTYRLHAGISVNTGPTCAPYGRADRVVKALVKTVDDLFAGHQESLSRHRLAKGKLFLISCYLTTLCAYKDD